MNNRTIFIIAALVLAAGAALVMYHVCIASGAATGNFAAHPWPAAQPYPHFGWHPWGFGFFLMPLFFMLFCFLIAGAIFRGAGHRHGFACGPFGARDRNDEDSRH